VRVIRGLRSLRTTAKDSVLTTTEGLFVALFGRPADPAGVSYFEDLTRKGADFSAVDAVSSQQEYADRFSGLSEKAKVALIYQTLFDRAPEAAGLTYWVGQLQGEKLNPATLAIAILDGAKGVDLSNANAKIAAADLFSSSLDLPFEQEAYSGSFATQLGREFLSAVTAANQPSENDAEDMIMRLFSSAGQIPAGGDKPVLTFVSPDFVKVDEYLEAGAAIFRAETINNIEFNTFRIGGQDAEAFSVDRDSGIVSLILEHALLDQEVASITITATDTAGNSATQAVTIVIATKAPDLPLLGLRFSNDQARLAFAPDDSGSNSADDISTGHLTADDEFNVDTIGIVPPQGTEIFF
jgi:hypothetical protein